MQKFIRELPRDEYPDFANHVDQHMTKSVRTTGKSEFEFGLDLILDGLEQMHDAASRRVAAKPTRAKRPVQRSGHPKKRGRSTAPRD
jgi:hypothetical protein